MSINIPVSIGELWDKYTILLIKQQKINNVEKLSHIKTEIDFLNVFMRKYSYLDNELFVELKKINEQLWDIEDKLRIKEVDKVFDQNFIELARSVYFTNDKRANVKTQINTLFNSILYEIKEYVTYC
jgi:predicted RNA-binding protein with EMAP domain